MLLQPASLLRQAVLLAKGCRGLRSRKNRRGPLHHEVSPTDPAERQPEVSRIPIPTLHTHRGAPPTHTIDWARWGAHSPLISFPAVVQIAGGGGPLPLHVDAKIEALREERPAPGQSGPIAGPSTPLSGIVPAVPSRKCGEVLASLLEFTKTNLSGPDFVPETERAR